MSTSAEWVPYLHDLEGVASLATVLAYGWAMIWRRNHQGPLALWVAGIASASALVLLGWEQGLSPLWALLLAFALIWGGVMELPLQTGTIGFAVGLVGFASYFLLPSSYSWNRFVFLMLAQVVALASTAGIWLGAASSIFLPLLWWTQQGGRKAARKLKTPIPGAGLVGDLVYRLMVWALPLQIFGMACLFATVALLGFKHLPRPWYAVVAWPLALLLLVAYLIRCRRTGYDTPTSLPLLWLTAITWGAELHGLGLLVR